MSGRITLAHGNGGKLMRELINEVFVRHLENPLMDSGADAVCLPAATAEQMVTVDGYTVQPLEFPGGSIGSLAIHGTVNDLAVAGAVARHLCLSVIIEEGTEISLLERIVADMAVAAKADNVNIVCGDTKVVPRGEGSGIYISTTGIGERHAGSGGSIDDIRPGDRILVSGPVGDHGAAVMLARKQFGLIGNLESDCANVSPLCHALLGIPGLRFMRDPTRGGLATIMHEISQRTGMGIRLQETGIPVRDQVSAICEILGYDPLYLACEGRVVAVIEDAYAEEALSRWKQSAQGRDAAIIGTISKSISQVVIETELGGERILPELEDEPLPRIC